MAYLGNHPGVASQRVVTTFTATAGQTTFTPQSGYTLGYLDVYHNGVRLVNGDDYTAANGVSFVLAEGAAVGDVVEAVAYIPRGLSDGYTKQEADALLEDKADLVNGVVSSEQLPPLNYVEQTSATGAARMPVGTTAQRPASPQAGMYRLNSTTGEPEWYDTTTSSWIKFRETPTLNIEYIIVAGGGGGASGWGGIGGGGGGAGGRLFNTASFLPGSGGLSVVVGAGGAGAASASSGAAGSQGGSSSFNSQSAVGGGGGTSWITGGVGSSSGSGGSGGGGTFNTISAGSGTSGQGFAGGAGSATANSWGGGGGGGATAVGQAGSGANGGNGGAGYTWLNGVAYAGGGGGGCNAAGNIGVGGTGGGGNGGDGATGSNGTANTGGGGGGGGDNSGLGGAGGSGVVIIRYAGTPRATGGTITESGGFTYHTFTSSGTFTA